MTGALILLAAGGTGGHLYPAEALAAELLRRGLRVALVTDRRGAALGGPLAEVAVHRVQSAAWPARPAARPPAAAPAEGFAWPPASSPQAAEPVPSPLQDQLARARWLLGRGRSAMMIGFGTAQAMLLLWRLRPRAVVGFGGYPSVPTMLAAGPAGTPTVLHEQNSVMGRANRLLARRAQLVATSFPDTRGVPKGPRQAHTGNPVRPGIVALHERSYPQPTQAGQLSLLITGGSQGAGVLGQIVPTAIASLPKEMRARLRITQQCRPEDLDAVRRVYADAEVEAELQSFFGDMPERLARAHLAICRAGASTIAELTVAGVPAILVPYPSAADDHQSINAAQVEQAGGGWLMPQSELTPATLARRLFALLRDPARLAAASAAARAFARPAAASDLADLVIEIGGLAVAPSHLEQAA